MQLFRTGKQAELHHKQSHVEKRERAPAVCQECGKRFNTQAILLEHFSITHL